MGYYIDQLAEQDRQKRLADLLIAGEAGSFPAFMPIPDYPGERTLGNYPVPQQPVYDYGGGERTLGNYPVPQQPDIRQQYAQPLMDTLAAMRDTPLSDYPAQQQPESPAQQQTMSQFFANPQPPRNPIYDQPEGVDRPGVVMQAAPNTIRNNTTGKVTQLLTSGVGGVGDMGGVGGSPAIDMSQNPVKTPYGTGYYLKGDSTRMLIPATGQIVDLGRDTAAERVRTKENLALDAQRATIANTKAETAIKNRTPEELAKIERMKRDADAQAALQRVREAAGIPGTPEYKKIQDAAKLEQKTAKEIVADKSVYKQVKSDTDAITTAISRLRSHPGLPAISGWEGYFPDAPETFLTSGDAKAAQTILDEIKGKTATLGRQLATAHGKLGNMAVQEWKIVSDSLAKLEPTSKEFPNQLANLEAAARGLEIRTKERYLDSYGDYIEKNPKFSLDRSGASGNNPSAPKLTSTEVQESLFNAQKAIQKNPANKAAIIEKLKANGIDTRGL